MCGIAVIYAQRHRRAVQARELDSMLDTMRHRGPDAREVRLPHPGVGFGHLRLAVLDLVPESDQPFESLDGRYVLSYNGEIFNYIELRSLLVRLGHKFRTQSDTEVLLASYIEWGPSAVDRFNGMWAFAIYDRETDSLFCSRDRFGAKPLYFASHDGRFLLASEIKALLVAAPALARPNLQSFSRFFRASFHSESTATFFSSVQRLDPAHNMRITRTAIEIWRYWDYPAEPGSLSFDDASATVRELLTDAISLRMRSDVPVGTSLSGGLDSATLACLLHTLYPGTHFTFTASFPGEPFDESPRAAALARSLGMESRSIAIEPNEVLPLLRRVVHHLDAPTQCPAVIPLWKIMEAMKGRVVVALDGQGSDELFGGYIDRIFGYSLWDSLVRKQFRTAAQDLHQHIRTWGWWTALSWSVRDIVPWSHRWYRLARRDEGVYSGSLRKGPDDVPIRPRDGVSLDPINRVLQQQHEGGLRTLLQYGDAISMAHSIEVRMPYLDYRLVEFASRLPGSFKVSGGQGKVLLRGAVKDIVPPDILQARRKLGFGTPLARWLRDHPRQLIEPVLFTDACRRRGLFDQARLREAVDRHISGQADLSSQIFRWLTAEIWFEQFVD